MAKKFFDIIPPKKIDFSPGKIKLKKETKPSRIPSSREILTPEGGSFKRIFFKSFVFLLILLVLVGGFGFFFLSKAEIEIWPETDTLSLEETLSVDLEIKEPDFEAKVIPGKTFSDQKSVSQEFSASGKVLKEEKATGIIQVYNEYSTSPRTLVPSRFVSTDGKLFWSLKRITIPGARYEKGKLVPGEIDVEVQAAEAGEDYNIGPSTFALPALAGSPLYTTIYGRSFSPMAGGFKGEISQVLQEDLEQAEKILVEKVRKDSRDFLKRSLPSDFVLLDETISQEIVEANSLVEAGAEVGSFDFQVKVNSEALGFKKSDIENFAKNYISLNTPESKKIQEESLEINYFPESIDLESGKIVLNLEIKAKVYSDIDLTELKKALLGKSREEVKIFLENLTQITKIEIKSWPFLKKKAPENMNKIELKLNLD